MKMHQLERYRYRLEESSSNAMTYLWVGFIVLILVIGYYVYHKKSIYSDPLNNTVKVNLAASQIPIPPFNTLMSMVTPRPLSATISRVSSVSEVNNPLACVMELYNLATYNIPEALRNKVILCYKESQTNPRLALNIIRQVPRLWFVLVADVMHEQDSSRPVPYPGLPTPRGLVNLNEAKNQFELLRQRLGPALISTVIIIPFLVRFMLENDIKTMGNIIDYTPDLEEGGVITIPGMVVIKNQSLVDILNYINSIMNDVVTGPLKPIPNWQTIRPINLNQPNEADVAFLGVSFYYSILRLRNNTYTPLQCDTSIYPTLQEDIRQTFTKENLTDLFYKAGDIK